MSSSNLKPVVTGGSSYFNKIKTNKKRNSNRKINSGIITHHLKREIIGQRVKCGCSKGDLVCKNQICSCFKSGNGCSEFCHNNKKVKCCNMIININ